MSIRNAKLLSNWTILRHTISSHFRDLILTVLHYTYRDMAAVALPLASSATAGETHDATTAYTWRIFFFYTYKGFIDVKNNHGRGR